PLGRLLSHRPHLPSPRTRRTPRTGRRVRPLTRLAAGDHHPLPAARPGRPHRPAKGHHQRVTGNSNHRRKNAMPDPAAGHTYLTRFRVPRTMWTAFGRICERQGITRTERLLAVIREDIANHGDAKD